MTRRSHASSCGPIYQDANRKRERKITAALSRRIEAARGGERSVWRWRGGSAAGGPATARRTGGPGQRWRE